MTTNSGKKLFKFYEAIIQLIVTGRLPRGTKETWIIKF